MNDSFCVFLGYLFSAEKCCKLLNNVFVGSVINMIICRECHAVSNIHIFTHTVCYFICVHTGVKNG